MLRNYISNSEIIIKILSSLHSIVCVSICASYNYGLIGKPLYSELLYLNGIGYFCIDLSYLFLYKKFADKMLWQFIIHHIICIIGLSYVNIHPYLVSKCFISEISTPFFNLSWFMHKNNYKNFIYIVNGLVICYLFLRYRLYEIYILYSSPYNHTLLTNSCLIVLLLLNSIWTYMIVYVFSVDIYKYIKQNLLEKNIGIKFKNLKIKYL